MFLINLSKGHPGPCNRAFVITSRRFSWTVWIFVLKFPARPLSGLVGDASSPPIKFTPTFWHRWYLPIVGIFIFTRCVVQHLGFLEKYWGLLSVIGGSTSNFSVSDAFGGRSEAVEKIDVNFHVMWWVSSVIPSRRYPLFFPGRGGIRPLFSSSIFTGCRPLVSLSDRGYKVLGGTASWLRAMSWEVFSMPSCFVVLRRRRSQRAIFHSFQRYFCVSMFPLILYRRVEFNICNRIMLLVLFFGVLLLTYVTT